MEMPRPTEAHEKLANLEGTWDGDERMHPSPWTPEGSDAHGVVIAAMKIDGFFLISDYEQCVDDQITFKGHGVYGWDAVKERYTMHWFDTMGMDPGAPALGVWAGDTLSFESESPMGRGRYVYTFINADTYTFRMEHSQAGDNWVPMMDATYRRRV